MNSNHLTHPPRFIVFEGLDGSGKTTCARRLAERMGAEYLTTPSPAVREFRDELIESLGPNQAACQLFYLSTVFDCSDRVRALLAAGRSVVVDRYFLSTQAYAAFRGSALGLDQLASQLMPADVTVFVDVALDVRRRRLLHRGATAADRETLAPGATEHLVHEHLVRRDLPVVGHWLQVDATHLSAEDLVEVVLAVVGGQVRRTPIETQSDLRMDARGSDGSGAVAIPTDRTTSLS